MVINPQSCVQSIIPLSHEISILFQRHANKLRAPGDVGVRYRRCDAQGIAGWRRPNAVIIGVYFE
jgi:hypothetical protein